MISSNKHFVSGRLKFESQDYEGALVDYTEAIREEENPSIYSERAVVYFYLKRMKESLADMNYAQSIDPDNPYRYSSRAYIKDAMGDTAGAIEDYEIAIKLDPEDSVAYNNLGLLQEKLGYKKMAKEHFKKADELAEVDQLLNRIQEKAEEEEKSEQNAEVVPDISDSEDVDEPENLRTLLKRTFTTRDGFKDYLKFIRNGFKR